MSVLPAAPHQFRYNEARMEAYDFVTRELGVRNVTPIGNLAMVDAVTARHLTEQGHPGNGHFDPVTRHALISEDPNASSPAASRLGLVGGGVHEFLHGATLPSVDIANATHPLLKEGVVGLGEGEFLRAGERKGLHKPNGAFVHLQGGASVTIPATYNYNQHDGTLKYAVTNGLVAASGIEQALEASRLDPRAVLRASNTSDGSTPHFDMIRWALRELKPGLEVAIDRLPRTNDGIGIAQGAHLIQEEIEKQKKLGRL